jgi:hypothetical protein
MITRLLCAVTLVAIAGAQSHAQQGRGGAGVFEWTAAKDAQPAPSSRFHWVDAEDDQEQRSVTIEKNQDTVLVFAPSAKGGTRISFSDGAKVIELRVDGDVVRDLEVIREGRAQSGHEARIEGGHIVVLAPSGERIAQFSVPQDDGAKREITWNAQAAERVGVARARASQAQGTARLRAATPGEAADVIVQTRPRRVIGITATSATDALAAQLGIEADKVIVIESVNDGMPAAKAGLQRFDIITKVDGAGPANIGRLTEVIETKGASEPIRLTILRNGREQVVEVRPVERSTAEVEIEIDDRDANFPFGQNVIRRSLTADEQARVEEAMARAHEALAMQQERFAQLQERLAREAEVMGRNIQQQFQNSEIAAEVRKAYEEAIRELSQANIQEQIERAMVEVQRAVESVDVERELRSLPRIEFFDQSRNNGRGVIVAPPAPAAPAAPGTPGAPRMGMRSAPAPDDSRLQALEERMARIERLLERIADDRDR